MRLNYNDLQTETDFLLFLHTRPEADTKVEFQERLFQHIELTWNYRGKGSPLVDLNRRFSHLASKFKVSVSEQVRTLSIYGQVMLVPHNYKLIAFPTGPWIEFCETAGGSAEGLRQREAVLEASLIKR